jgi:hypothetical protein
MMTDVRSRDTQRTVEVDGYASAIQWAKNPQPTSDALVSERDVLQT